MWTHILVATEGLLPKVVGGCFVAFVRSAVDSIAAGDASKNNCSNLVKKMLV